MTEASAMAPFQPKATELTMPFWAGAAEGRLLIARCVACREWQHPPLESCRLCGSELRPEDAPLHGVVYSSTMTHHPATPLYPVPYQVAVVEVGGAGGPRIVVRVTDDDLVEPGTPVRIEMHDLPGGAYKVPTATTLERNQS